MAACCRLPACRWLPSRFRLPQPAAAATLRAPPASSPPIYSITRPSRSLTAVVVAKKGSDSKKTKAPNKADLPTKVCITCGRPFTWRKKWEKVWDEVKYCSDRCRSSRNSGAATPPPVE